MNKEQQKARAIVIDGKYLNSETIAELTDGELLDLIYHVTDTFRGPSHYKLAVITELLEIARSAN